jgi:SulP family sulfate permease
MISLVLSITAVVFFRLDTKDIQIIGNIPNGFPDFALPQFSFHLLITLAPLALTIALLGFMESLSISKSVAKKEKYEIKANKEFIALGFSNIIGSFFSSYPVNGSFSRTMAHFSAPIYDLGSVFTLIVRIRKKQP